MQCLCAGEKSCVCVCEYLLSLPVRLFRLVLIQLSHFLPFHPCAHPLRLSTIVNADSILCVKDGRVVQSGTHNELMDKGGVYSSLVSKQVEALGMANNSTSNGGEKP